MFSLVPPQVLDALTQHHASFLQAVEGAVGLPVAVQCVALPWQEELCLRFMKEVETLTHGTKRNV